MDQAYVKIGTAATTFQMCHSKLSLCGSFQTQNLSYHNVVSPTEIVSS